VKCASALLSSVASPVLLEFSTLSLEVHDFGNQVDERKMCVLNLSTNLSKMFLIPRKTERDVATNLY